MPEAYVPEPTIVLMGCRAWPPPPRPDGSCGVCGGGIRPADLAYHCAACSASAPPIEARCRGARIGLQARDRHEIAAKAARDRLAKKWTALTEAQRRRLWNGYRGTVLAEFAGDLNNVAKVGRDWLTAIGQQPDWSLILDGGGRVIGRCDEEAA